MISETVGNVLKRKTHQQIFAVAASSLVADAVRLMSEKGIGALIVRTGNGPVEGILTERDLMRRVLNERRDPTATRMSEVMSHEVRRVAASATVEEALRLMVVHGHRHLVVEDGADVQGLVSIRDLMSWIVLPDEPIAAEGRVGVIKARAADVIESLHSRPS